MTNKEKKQKLLDALYEPYKTHHNCPIKRSDPHSPVFGVGNPDAQILLIGEAPGRQEDEQGLPFVGRSGQLLTKVLHSLDIQRTDIFITNIVKCRPPLNRTPTPKEVQGYKDFLLKQIEIIQPKVICTLGSVATHTFLPQESPMSALRGRIHYWNNIPIIPTYHPAYILRNMTKGEVFIRDLEKVAQYINP